jgi:hypothetical protein
MYKAKINIKYPLSLAKYSVLNPTSKQSANNTSTIVTIITNGEIRASGTNGFIRSVYAIKLFQFPQAKTSSLQNPNLSVTADKTQWLLLVLKII